jgi:hypothetical protein
MRKLFILTILLIAVALLSAQNAGRYLIKIDRSVLSGLPGQNSSTPLLQKLPTGMNIFHISGGFILADADDSMLRALPEGSYSLVGRFPVDGNWYLLTTLPDRENEINSQLGTEIIRMDETILLKTTLSDFELPKYTDMPFVRMDFTPIRLNITPTLNLPGQTRVDFGNLLTQVNADSIMWFIQQLQDFGTRNAAADNRLQVANWIRDQFIRFGIANAHVEQFFIQGIDQYNVVATIPGTLAPDKYIIVGGHHDSIVSGGDPLVPAPGADDNASGTVAALEMARVMKTNNYSPECSIRFVTFACEEYGLWGSKFHAQQALDTEQDIKVMINHDMIGFCTNTPDNWLVRLMPYDGFLTYTGYAMQVVDAQTTLTPYAGSANSAGSDSHSFWQRGFPAIYFFEDQFCPYYHSGEDVVANVNPQYAKEVIKASTAVCVTYDQIPSPVSAVTVADMGTGSNLLVSWLIELPESDITSYKVYVTDDIYVTPVEYETTFNQIVIPDLTSGVLYYIGVAALDSDGNTGLPVWTTGIPEILPATPTGFEDLPGFNFVQLQWEPNTEMDLAGYNIYRTTNPDSGWVLFDSVMLTENVYTDMDVEDLVWYYYKLTAEDENGFESIPTAVIRSRAVTLNQGILIVDETSNGTSVFTPPDLVCDQFFDDVLHSFQKSHFDTDTDGAISLADIGIYSAILWHGNDSGNLSYPYTYREELTKYLQAGGKIMVTSYYPSKAFENNNNYPTAFQAGDFIYDEFGIQDVLYNTSARFRYALPEGSGFPPLTVDSLKTVAPLLGHIYNIESIGCGGEAVNAYFYGSDYDNTAPQGNMNGTPVGVFYNTGTGSSVVLSFPLYNMKQDEVTNLMYHVFHNLFGETVSNQDDSVVTPTGLAVSRIYPNPFTNYLSLEIEGIKASKPLTISIYNVKGQKVKDLYSGTAKAATQNLAWDGRDEQGAAVSNSIYFIRAEQNGRAVSGKILKLK